MPTFLMQRLDHRIEVNNITGAVRCSCGWTAGPFIFSDESMEVAQAHCDAVPGREAKPDAINQEPSERTER